MGTDTVPGESSTRSGDSIPGGRQYCSATCGTTTGVVAPSKDSASCFPAWERWWSRCAVVELRLSTHPPTPSIFPGFPGEEANPMRSEDYAASTRDLVQSADAHR